MKYVYFIPKGGINDIFVQINNVIKYCINHERVLLLEMNHSMYNINFSDYFDIENCKCNIIYDSNIIKETINNSSLSIYPNIINSNSIISFHNDKELKWNSHCTIFSYKDTLLKLPEKNVNEDIIVHVACGGGNGFNFLKKIILKDNIKHACIKKMKKLVNNYLCIHVRNTDLKCNYKELYNKNKKEIHSYKQIYICTDDKNVVSFFKSKKLNVFCFTTFPKGNYYSLHKTNDITSKTKIYDLFVDLYMATNSDKILSNSKGGFINLLHMCHNHKKIMLDNLS